MYVSMREQLVMSLLLIPLQSLEWYDHPDARKYLLTDMNPPPTSSTSSVAPPHEVHSVKHILSPHSPGATPRTNLDQSKKTLAHINSLAQQEVEHALKDFEITNQVSFVRSLDAH